MSTQLHLVPEPDESPHRKGRGAFFTPSIIADYMSSWAIRERTDVVLEPSCGEAVFLAAAAKRLQRLGARGSFREHLEGCDIHEESIRIARRALADSGAEARLTVGNFFDFKTDKAFDVVIGNPPFVRYQSFAGEAREKGLQAARIHGVQLSRLASSWAAFAVHAASFLKPAGRMALVLPAELLSVNYAAPVRRFLMERFAEVRLVAFEERVFPGVLEEVVLLLAEGRGPTDHFSLCQAQNLDDLASVSPRTCVPADTEAKWLTALVPIEAATTYSEAAGQAVFATLLDWGDTNLGMVSGNNKYFALTADAISELGLSDDELLKISPPGSRHLRGLTFTDRMWRQLLRSGSRCHLFDPHPLRPSAAAMRYIREGEQDGVHKAYKCRIRKPWWVVPKVKVPDLFLTYMNHDVPRLVSNRARLLYLNSIHGVILKRGLRQLGMDLLPIATLNSLSLLGAELVGRSYGGGMLKVEPKEADKLPVPSPETLRGAQRPLRSLRPQLSRYLRNGDLDAVVKLVDKVLLRDHLKMGRTAVEHLRAARERLYDRRAARARGK